MPDMKTIYYEPAGRIHSTQWELINHPPTGYKFVTKPPSAIVRNDFIFDKLRLQLLDQVIPLNYAKAKLDSRLEIPEADIIFAYNHLVFRDIPWIGLVEWAHILVGRDTKFLNRYRDSVSRTLRSANCKGIITWSDVARRSVLLNYDVPPEKVTIIHHAVQPVKIDRDYNRDKIHLLFVGSANTPEDWDAKGARDVIAAFEALRHRYDDLYLTIRARIPKGWYHPVKGLQVIDKVLPKRDLDALFRKADIFVLPSHLCQEMVLVEAMSYGLPVITSWIGSTCGEYVDHGRTGMVLSVRALPYFTGNDILASETIERPRLIRSAQKRSAVVEELSNTIERLVKDWQLRKRLGEAAKAEVDSGMFSVGNRDRLLTKVLED